MKKISLLICLLLTSAIGFSQTADVSYASAKRASTYYSGTYVKDTLRPIRFAVPTPGYDTLYIAKNDELGQLTYKIWLTDPKYKGKNPVIILTDNIAYYEQKYAYVSVQKRIKFKN